MGTDTLAFYYSKIHTYPFLTDSEEQRISQILQKRGDARIRNKLVEPNLRLCFVVARQFLWSNMDREDLIMAGNIGLIIAAQKHDHTLGRFSEYALWWIRNAISRTVMNHNTTIHIPNRLWKKRGRIRRTERSIWQKTGRTPSDAEIAIHADLPQEEVTDIRHAIGNMTAVSIHEPLHTDTDDTETAKMTLEDILQDDSARDPSFYVVIMDEYKAAQERVAAFIRGLNSFVYKPPSHKRDLEIFKMRYGISPYHRRSTFEDVGGVFNMSRQCAHQIVADLWKRSKRKLKMKEEDLEQDLSLMRTIEEVLHVHG